LAGDFGFTSKAVVTSEGSRGDASTRSGISGLEYQLKIVK